MKKIILILSALAVSSLSFFSCKKTVSPKKLDGEWTLVSGTSISSNDLDGNGKSNVTKMFYTGSTVEIESTYESGITTKQTENSTSSYSFDKKAGTYKIISSNTSSSTLNGQAAFTKTTAGLYVSAGTYDRKTVKTTKTTEEGTFTITGGTGDIEKNSQIVLSPLRSSSNIVSQHTYFVAGQTTKFDITGKHSKSHSNATTYDPLVASNEENITSNTKTLNPLLYNVVSLNGGVMNLVGESSNSTINGSKTTSFSSKHDFLLSKKD